MWRIGSQMPPSRMMIPWVVVGAGATIGPGWGIAVVADAGTASATTAAIGTRPARVAAENGEHGDVLSRRWGDAAHRPSLAGLEPWGKPLDVQAPALAGTLFIVLAFPYQPIAPAPQEPNLAVQGRTVFVRSPAGVPTGVFAYSLDGGEPRRFLARPGTQNLDGIETSPQALALLTTSGPPDQVLYGPLNGPLKRLNKDVLNIGLSGSTMLSLEGYTKQIDLRPQRQRRPRPADRGPQPRPPVSPRRRAVRLGDRTTRAGSSSSTGGPGARSIACTRAAAPPMS